jgi:hypothetical protein
MRIQARDLARHVLRRLVAAVGAQLRGVLDWDPRHGG